MSGFIRKNSLLRTKILSAGYFWQSFLFLDAESLSCLLGWATTFSLPSEHQLKRSSLLTTLPTLNKEWKVSFEFKATSYKHRAYAQILQLTIGSKSGSIGDRTPALWIHKSRGVYLVTTLNGKPNAGKYFRTSKPSINAWNTVEIAQVKTGSNYIFSLVINNKTLWSVKNTDPREFSSVKVFASSPWYAAQAGSIRGLRIENLTPGGK